ncbi:MAG TPA: OmpH family outer membrane protein [Chthonomonadaceae bacterium]|nr:OmpH family outer membrane protein [Chthonomonadaceae bacterium]
MQSASQTGGGLFFMRATVFAAIVLGVVAALAAHGADDKNGLRIAVVNPGRLLAEYKYAKQSNDTLEKIGNDAKLYIDTWRRYPLLSMTDQETLAKLRQQEATVGANMSKQEKDQLQGLITKHDNLVKEYNALLAKPNGDTTPADADRLTQLGKAKADTEARIKSKDTDASTEITKRQDEFNQKIDKDVREALNKVAKEKGMNLVFSSQVVLFADTDITDDVLKHLNK